MSDAWESIAETRKSDGIRPRRACRSRTQDSLIAAMKPFKSAWEVPIDPVKKLPRAPLRQLDRVRPAAGSALNPRRAAAAECAQQRVQVSGREDDSQLDNRWLQLLTILLTLQAPNGASSTPGPGTPLRSLA